MLEPCNSAVVLAAGGYAALNARLEKLETIANRGIADPEKALECCRKIKTELYGLLQTLQEVCVIKPGAWLDEITF
jgi:hypothetical protein